VSLKTTYSRRYSNPSRTVFGGFKVGELHGGPRSTGWKGCRRSRDGCSTDSSTHTHPALQPQESGYGPSCPDDYAAGEVKWPKNTLADLPLPFLWTYPARRYIILGLPTISTLGIYNGSRELPIDPPVVLVSPVYSVPAPLRDCHSLSPAILRSGVKVIWKEQLRISGHTS